MAKSDSLFDAIAAGADGLSVDDALERQIWRNFGRTCAVLVLDSTGFSRVTQSHGIVFFLNLLLRLRGIAMEAATQNGAIRWRSEADNFFAEFDRVDQALGAAFDIHRELAEAKIDIGPGDPFGAGIGIGYGPLLQSDLEGVFGDEMNLTSKLGEDIAKGGETLLTQAALENLISREGIKFEKRRFFMSGVEIISHCARLK